MGTQPLSETHRRVSIQFVASLFQQRPSMAAAFFALTTKTSWAGLTMFNGLEILDFFLALIGEEQDS